MGKGAAFFNESGKREKEIIKDGKAAKPGWKS